MKSKIKVISFILFILTINITFGQIKNETLRVEGKCEMCKVRIEEAAMSVNGIKTADWNVESKTLTISFDAKIGSGYRVMQAVANVGHRTKYIKPNELSYDALPDCCKYQPEGRQRTCHHAL